MQPYPPVRRGSRPNYLVRRVSAAGSVLVIVVVLVVLAKACGGGDQATESSTSTTAVTTTTEPLRAPPACTTPEEPEATVYSGDGDWARTLLDPSLALPDDYQPSDLVPASAAHYSADFQIREAMAEDLNGLRNDILEAGIPEVAIERAYVSIADRKAAFDSLVAREDRAAALAEMPAPGTDEHHLGTAIDFRLLGEEGLDPAFGDTETGRWLAANAWRNGFIQSFPAGREDRTCNAHEPWHYRYVGVQTAARVHASGVTLREYLWHWEVTGTEPGAAEQAGAGR